MKKVLLFAVVLGSMTLTSCKKDYTCTCTIFGTSTAVEYNDLNSSDAKELETACESTGICAWDEK